MKELLINTIYRIIEIVVVIFIYNLIKNKIKKCKNAK